MLLNFLLFLLSCDITYDANMMSIDMQVHNVASYNMGFEKSKKSAVIIEAYDQNNVYRGQGSGNYFYSGSRKFIITAQHVIGSSAGAIFVREQNGERHFAEVLYTELSRDVAILYVKDELTSTTPIHFDYTYPFNNEAKRLYFTSSPDGTPFVLGDGRIVKEGNSYYYAQSLAWPGSSGAVALDARGNIIGVITGVRVAYDSTIQSSRMIENYVYVSRIDFIDRWKIKSIFQDAGK